MHSTPRASACGVSRLVICVAPRWAHQAILAILCTFAKTDEFVELCDTLGARLLHQGDLAAATLVYICAGTVDKACRGGSPVAAKESMR